MTVVIDQEAVIERYLEMRKAKKVLKDQFEAEVAQIDGGMERIEKFFLSSLNASGLQSVRTDAGTAFKKGVVSVTVADWPATLGFIQANGLWHLLTSSVSKTAVEEYRKENNDLPPGVNWREETVVQIRKAA